jgi:hypothetical protein
MNYGKIITGSNHVVVRNRGYSAITPGNANSFVRHNAGALNSGILKYLNQSGSDTGTYHFPVGTLAKGFQRLSLQFTTALPSGVNTMNVSFNETTAANNTALGSECGTSYHSFPATPLNNGYWQLQLSPGAQFSSGVYTPYLYNTNYTNPIAGWTVMHNKGNPATASQWFLEPGPGIPTCAQIISPVSAVRRVGATAAAGLMGVPTVYLATAQSFLPLPVELLQFEADPGKDAIALQWTTASEENNKGFEVQRTQDLSGDFETIAFVPGNGTTTEIHSYEFIDRAISPNREYFYRLRQIDFDGGIHHSRIVSARIGEAGFSFFVYYDAVASRANLVYDLDAPSDVRIELFNALGQEVATVHSGRQDEGSHVYLIDPSATGTGNLLVVRMTVNGEVQVKRACLPGF